MISKKFEEIDKQYLDEVLLPLEIEESSQLDYKLEWKDLKVSENKSEFLKDVTALANSSGGFILYGIEEKIEDGNKTGKPGMLLGINNFDDTTIQQITEIISSNITPRIIAPKIKRVEGFAEGPVVVLYIPKSYMSPHGIGSVDGSKGFRFPIRVNTSTKYMDVSQIRGAFLASENFSKQAQEFKMQRISKHLNGEVGFPYEKKGTMLIHVIPHGSFDGKYNKKIVWDKRDILRIYNRNLADHDYNNEGSIYYDNIYGNKDFVQYFRNYSTEICINNLIQKHDKTGFEFFKAQYLCRNIYESLCNLFSKEWFVDIQDNVSIYVSLIGFEGLRCIHGISLDNFDDKKIITHDVLHFSEILVESGQKLSEHLFHPLFDYIYQTGSLERCILYDENGNFTNWDF
ncbi:MAG: helix-turn-helix domain-containing protein [Sumerlaeia bacterium]